MGTNNTELLGLGFNLNTPDTAICGDGWAFVPAPGLPSREALLAEQAKLLADVDYMHENYEGCDWCCGGGDEWMEECCTRLDEIEKLLAE